MPLFGTNIFKLLPHVKELFVPMLGDILRYGLIHRAWYYTHQLIIVSDPDELANVRASTPSIHVALILRTSCSARTLNLSTARSTSARALACVLLGAARASLTRRTGAPRRRHAPRPERRRLEARAQHTYAPLHAYCLRLHSRSPLHAQWRRCFTAGR